MPRFLSRILRRTDNPHSTSNVPANRYEGFNANGAIVLSDRRGTRKAEIPDVDTKALGMGSDPLKILASEGLPTFEKDSNEAVVG